MSGPLNGIRVVEVAMWSYVPSCGAALADWGAEVVKVEHPVHGDPLRGLVVSGVSTEATGGVSFMWEIGNRGKRSVGIDLRNPEGTRVLHRLAASADVFLTSLLPAARTALHIDVDDIRAVNPRIVYARGSGTGPDGPEAERGGYDLAAFWARAGVQHAVSPIDAASPRGMPAAGFGDMTSGLALAGGVAAALLQRERTGVGCVVDGSLLGTGMWSMSSEVTGTTLLGRDRLYRSERELASNPLMCPFRTSDGRFIQLVLLEADRHWPDLCARIGRPDLLTDPRFADAPTRKANAAACIAELDAVFAAHPLAHWEGALAEHTGVWSVVRTAAEASSDVQARANDLVRELQVSAGGTYTAVMNPLRVDDGPVPSRVAPELGADTEAVLLELGLSWDDIVALKDAAAIS